MESERFRVIMALVIMSAAVPVGGQESAGEPTAVVDPRPTYVVGFSELSRSNLPPEFSYIATTLPRLIVAELDAGQSGDLTHRLSETERETYAFHLIAEDLDDAIRDVSFAVRARDQLLFDQGATDERFESADTALAEAETRLRELESFEPTSVEIPKDKPIEFWSGREIGRLLSPVEVQEDLRPVAGSLLSVAMDADLDLLIWGTVEEIRGYLKVDFYAWSPYSGAIELEGAGTVALPSDIGRDAAFITAGIATVLLGREWASVTITSNAEDAEILVDGALAGFGTASSRYRDPGEVQILVRAMGYTPERRTITLEARESVELAVELEPAIGRTVRIESAPAQANVYLDSVWVGLTPLDLPVPGSPQVARIRADGFLESRFVVGPQSPERIARALLPDTIIWADELGEKRDAFYRSMTWFVISVPVTLALNGVYQNVFGAYPPDELGYLTQEDQIRFARFGNIFYWASAGGLMLNVGLLVNAGINLFEYLDVGEGSHNQ